MRNLLKYPVTHDEKMDLLRRLRVEFLAESKIGDIRPVLLTAIMEDVELMDIFAPVTIQDAEGPTL